MRRLFLCVLLSAPAVALAADEPPPVPKVDGFDAEKLLKPEEVDQKYPLPQDAAKLKAARDAARARARALTIDLFEKYGDTTTAAAAAKTALEAVAEAAARPPVVRGGYTGRAERKLADAVLDGCGDPLVNALYLANKPAFEFDAGRWGDEWKTVLAGLDQRKYPPVTKLRPLFRRAVATRGGWDTYWAAFSDAARGATEAVEDRLLEEAAAAEAYWLTANDTRENAHKEVSKALDRGAATAWLKAMAAGRFHARHAWDARKDADKDDKSDQATNLFDERLKEAETAFKAADAAAPNRPGPAREMIAVCKGLNRPRDEMEGWFKKAMAADPDDASACLQKLDYLTPKWRGTRDDVMAFGRQCLRTRNDYAGLPLVLFAAHDGYATFKDYPTFEGYYRLARVKGELREVFETYLRANPGDAAARGRYMCLCVVWGLPAQAEGHHRKLDGFAPPLGNWAAGVPFQEFIDAIKTLR